MKALPACKGFVAIADSGLRRVLRELLLGVKMCEVEFFADAEAVVYALRGNPAVDLIIAQSDLPGGGCAAIARFVRWKLPTGVNTLPIISVGRDWTRETLIETREAGICEIIAMPTSLQAVQVKLLSALDPKRAFISTDIYRGRCRRRKSSKGYQGPFRRAEDRVAEQLNQAEKRSARLAERQEGGAAVSLSPPPPPPEEAATAIQTSAVEFDGETGNNRQTRAVIDKAFVTARLTEQLLARLATTGEESVRAALNKAVADAEERLINLMALVQLRIEQHGCSLADLERLRLIRNSVDTCATSLLRALLFRLIKSADDIVSGRRGLPFSIGVAMQGRMSYAQLLINVGGGLDHLDDDLKGAVAKARDLVSQVVEMEAGIMPLRRFDTGASSRSSGARKMLD